MGGENEEQLLACLASEDEHSLCRAAAAAALQAGASSLPAASFG